jgi:RNA polymerase sigma-54 factor
MSLKADDDYDDSESDRVEAEDINIDEYLSSDDTPDYKTQTNNYSDDDDEERISIGSTR